MFLLIYLYMQEGVRGMFPLEGRDSWSFFPLSRFAVGGVFTGQLPPRVASPTSTTLSLWMWEIGSLN